MGREVVDRRLSVASCATHASGSAWLPSAALLLPAGVGRCKVSYVGADADGLEVLGREFGLQARRLRDRQRRVSALLVSAPWSGRDADRFRQEWSRTHRPALERVAAVLEAAAALLATQAAQQRHASNVGVSESAGAASGAALLGLSWPFGLSEGMTPEAASRWWASLSRPEQEALVRQKPHLIGSLDGIPGWARDRANRAVVASELERLRSELGELERDLDRRAPGFMPEGRLRSVVEGALTNDDRRADIVKAKIEALTLLQGYRGDRQILLVDTSGERVKAAVAVGNVDTARNIAVTVHGFNSTVEGSMSGYVRDAAYLQQMASDIDRGSETAVVVWMGYESPQTKDLIGSGSVASSDSAERAAPALRGFLDGIDVSRQDDVRKVLIGHSYGSLVSGLALEGGHHSVDAVVFQGSPGIGVDDVRELGVPEGQVFVAEADGDPIADMARFSEDPSRMRGVTVLETGATARGSASFGHSSYLQAHSTSLYNHAIVVTDPTEGLLADRGGNWGAGDMTRVSVTRRTATGHRP